MGSHGMSCKLFPCSECSRRHSVHMESRSDASVVTSLLLVLSTVAQLSMMSFHWQFVSPRVKSWHSLTSEES